MQRFYLIVPSDGIFGKDTVTITENDDYQRFIPEVKKIYSGEVVVAKDLMQF